ncbi:hypothetical protein MCOR31_012093 [Pyricularia oryzae]|nr:hypothetical protein MCOR31_012093 [Pyricularia oryzae]
MKFLSRILTVSLLGVFELSRATEREALSAARLTRYESGEVHQRILGCTPRRRARRSDTLHFLRTRCRTSAVHRWSRSGSSGIRQRHLSLQQR